MLIVLTGKTASGKDTIKELLLYKYPGMRKVLTTTSRLPRAEEKDGADYHFLSKDQFQKAILAGKFIEYVEYGGNFYGTQKKDLGSYLNDDLLWRIDPSRAGEVRNFLKRAFPKNIADKVIEKLIVIYITTSDEIVLERLKKRGLSDKEIQKRMTDDRKIWQQFKKNYDFIVENIPGHLELTVDKITQIIKNRNS